MLIILNGGCDCTFPLPLPSLLPLEKEGCGEIQRWPQLLQLMKFCYICKEAREQVSRSPLPLLCGSGMDFLQYLHTCSTS